MISLLGLTPKKKKKGKFVSFTSNFGAIENIFEFLERMSDQ